MLTAPAEVLLQPHQPFGAVSGHRRGRAHRMPQLEQSESLWEDEAHSQQ